MDAPRVMTPTPLGDLPGMMITVSSRESLSSIDRTVRARVARDGQVWVFAEQGGYRQLRRLAARFEREPIPGGDSALFGHPLGNAIDGDGGMLVVSATPFAER